MEDWKVQCSVKKGDVMWNFRGDTVYEVQKMKDEVFGASPTPAVAVAETSPVVVAESPAAAVPAVSAAPPAPSTDHELTPVEKARLKMQQGGK